MQRILEFKFVTNMMTIEDLNVYEAPELKFYAMNVADVIATSTNAGGVEEEEEEIVGD